MHETNEDLLRLKLAVTDKVKELAADLRGSVELISLALALPQKCAGSTSHSHQASAW